MVKDRLRRITMADKELELWDSVLEADHVQKVVSKLTEKQSEHNEWPESDKKSAAVLVPLTTVDRIPSVLFTLRSRELSHHRNQVSFPGGIADSTDATPQATALRENEEELGIPCEDVEVWGKLQSFPGRNFDTMITPVIGFVRALDLSKLRVNHSEVEEVFTLPLHHLANTSYHGYTKFKMRSPMSTYRSPVFLGGPHRIWGFTAFVLDMVLLRMAPRGFKYVPIMSRTFSTAARRTGTR